MTIAIIDAELIAGKRHRFPNLCSMKISAYHKSKGDTVYLKTEYENLENFDKVYISKVFTKTEVPEAVLNMPNVQYGGTGFYYDEAEPLPDEIEHIMPDYHLYDEWVQERLKNGGKPKEYAYYTDYSIGYMTRGCFRKCDFCVNKKYSSAKPHSPLAEFYDPTRKKICLLDDNFLACPKWRELLADLQSVKKPFQFKQGLDERLLTEEKCEALFKSIYDGDWIFAFDNIADREIIEEKAHMIRRYRKEKGHHIKFYVLCGFDRNGIYDDAFWKQDILDTFERIVILSKYNFKPYIMRFEKAYETKWKGVYIAIAAWCNQPVMFSGNSFRKFCEHMDDYLTNGKRTCSTWRYFTGLLKDLPESEKYVDIIPNDIRLDYSEW